MNYTTQQLSRMRYELPELEAMLVKNPMSLPLRNGVARIREILGLPQTVTPIDATQHLDDMISLQTAYLMESSDA